MTRKRFIKLLMSYGYSRNDAVYIANKTKIPYKDAIQYYRVSSNFTNLANEHIKKFTSSLEEMAKSAIRAAKSLRVSICKGVIDGGGIH